MFGVFVNMASVLLGSLLGIFFRSLLRERMQKALMTALALCTFAIGVSSAVGTGDILCVIICMACGTALGEILHIDDMIENAGESIRRRLPTGTGGAGRFTEGFVSSSILFCVGSMTIIGSLQAGIKHDYSILFAKSILDFVSSIALGAAMGIGVAFSVLFILVLQGGLVLLSGLVGPALSEAVITEMSAIGGTILIGMAINILDLGKQRIRVANMIPAIILPILYFPVRHWLHRLF